MSDPVVEEPEAGIAASALRGTTMAPDDPVVEWLLERSAKTMAEQDHHIWSRMSEFDKSVYRGVAADFWDAVLPGWRDGISREVGVREIGKEHVEPWPTEEMARREVAMLNRHRELRCEVVACDVLRSGWLPVEDGTQ